jgi:hypothetical protein
MVNHVFEDLRKRKAPNTCLLHLVASQWKRVAFNPSQVIQRSNLSTTVFPYISQYPGCEESLQVGVSHALHKRSQ